MNSGTACGRRVEVLLLHQAGSEPSGTLDWLKPRPLLARHHHVRLSHNKVRSMQSSVSLQRCQTMLPQSLRIRPHRCILHPLEAMQVRLCNLPARFGLSPARLLRSSSQQAR